MKIRIESSDGTIGYAEAEILLIGFGITVDAICKQYDDADIYVKVNEPFKLEEAERANTIWVKPSETKKPSNIECGNALSCGKDFHHVCRLPRGHEGKCVCYACSNKAKEDLSETNLEGKHVVMSINAYHFPSVIDRIFHCESGFGLDPEKSGTKIYGHFIIDNEECYVRRYDVERLATDKEVQQARERLEKKR